MPNREALAVFADAAHPGLVNVGPVSDENMVDARSVVGDLVGLAYLASGNRASRQRMSMNRTLTHPPWVGRGLRLLRRAEAPHATLNVAPSGFG